MGDNRTTVSAWQTPLTNRPIRSISDQDYHRIVGDHEYATRPGSYDWESIDAELIRLDSELERTRNVG